MLEIRLASRDDLPAFARIYAAAKAFMRAAGNPHQ